MVASEQDMRGFYPAPCLDAAVEEAGPSGLQDTSAVIDLDQEAYLRRNSPRLPSEFSTKEREMWDQYGRFGGRCAEAITTRQKAEAEIEEIAQELAESQRENTDASGAENVVKFYTVFA